MSGLGQRVSRGHPADLLQDLCCQQPPQAPGEPAVCCSRSGEGCSRTSESLLPLGGAMGPPLLLLARGWPDAALFGPPFPESLQVCWLPAPAWRILFLPLR